MMGHAISLVALASKKSFGPALWVAADEGDVPKVIRLLRRPGQHVNWQDNEWENTPLFRACLHGHTDVARLLLADNRTDENLPNRLGETPFFVSCECGHLDIVRTMVKNDHIDINKADMDGATPLWIAANEGHLHVIKQVLVSGRHVNTRTRTHPGPTSWSEKTAEERARQVLHPLIASLLHRFDSAPQDTIARLRLELGIADTCAAETFALLLFLCDDHLQLVNHANLLDSSTENEWDDDEDAEGGCHHCHWAEKAARRIRFFKIAMALPMEVQMLLCNRLHLRTKDYVTVEKTERALKAMSLAIEKPRQKEKRRRSPVKHHPQGHKMRKSGAVISRREMNYMDSDLGSSLSSF